MPNYSSVQPLLDWVIDYRDSFGLLVNVDKDGGDCAHNFPIHYINLECLNSKSEFGTDPRLEFLHDLGKVSQDNQELLLVSGQHVRHADLSKWYSKLKYMSRDQTVSLLNGMVFYNLTDKVEALYIELKNRKFFHWNTEESDPPYQKKVADPVSLYQMRLFISTLPRLKRFKVLLPLLDLDLLYGAVHGYKQWDTSPKLYSAFLTLDKQNSHTFVSKLAAKLFKKAKVGQLIEDAYVKNSLAIPPLGFLLRLGYEKWSVV